MSIFRRLFERPQVLPPGVHFYHHRPTKPANLGDELCSPKHYFEFKSDLPALILGGGAFKNLGTKQARQYDVPVRIAWGVGLSDKVGEAGQSLDIAEVMQTYSKATTRDPLIAKDGIALMPCVSVLHSLVDKPPGNRVGLVLNYGSKASGPEVDDLLSRYRDRGFISFSNGLSLAEYTRLFAQTDEIITNSYHAAYWGLLSGRKVRVAGYSSKFFQLLQLLGLPQRISIYTRGSSQSLAQALEFAAQDYPLELSDSNNKKMLFREMNLEFAATLASLGICAKSLASLDQHSGAGREPQE